jgi:hypothetical protein
MQSLKCDNTHVRETNTSQKGLHEEIDDIQQLHHMAMPVHS